MLQEIFIYFFPNSNLITEKLVFENVWQYANADSIMCVHVYNYLNVLLSY